MPHRQAFAMTKLRAFALAVLAVAATAPAFAQDRPIDEGPDLSSLPERILPSTAPGKREAPHLAKLQGLDAALAGKIERKLKRTPDQRERIVYMLQRIVKIDEQIDVAELNHKRGDLKGKATVTRNIEIKKQLSAIMAAQYWSYLEHFEDKATPDGEAAAEALQKLYAAFARKYNAFRAERRKRFGLHKVEGKTEPATKKADDKPKKPATDETRKTKKVCSSDGLTGEMNCVEVLIDEEG